VKEVLMVPLELGRRLPLELVGPAESSCTNEALGLGHSQDPGLSGSGETADYDDPVTRLDIR
jgi:hypothetical protein